MTTKAKKHYHSWRKDGMCRCGVSRTVVAVADTPEPNPWLIGAQVKVRGGAGLDSHLTGHIVAVEPANDLHICDVHLSTGRVVQFLSTQLVLV